MGPRLADFILMLWVLYITIMTIVSWFGPNVDSFESWLITMVAWMFGIVAGFAVRGHP
jgi:hypothetical protein